MLREIIEPFKIYESLNIPVISGLWYRLCSKIDTFLIKREPITNALNNDGGRKTKVIASLTSFPGRISTIHWSIKSLMTQTYKPDRIVLWLAEEQFPSRTLPKELLELVNYGLEICWCEDLYGHKKYYYLVENQKHNEIVITFDDDIIYSPKCIERLMKTYAMFPNCLICERAQSYIDTSDPNIKYNPGKWNVISDIGIKEPSFSLNPSPGGGCLIPYGAFHEDALDKQKIRDLAYKNDDLWYMFMCALNGTKIVKTRKYHRIFTIAEGTQVAQMATENVIGNKNVDCVKKLIERYPQAWNNIIGAGKR